MTIEGLGELRTVMHPHLHQKFEIELYKNIPPYLDTEDVSIDEDINSFNQKDKSDGLTLNLNQLKNKNTPQIKNIPSSNEIKISKSLNNTNIEVKPKATSSTLIKTTLYKIKSAKKARNRTEKKYWKKISPLI